MHHDWIHSDKFHQHNIPGKAIFKLFINHGVAAIFDHHGSTGEFLYIRQCFGKYLGNGFGTVKAYGHGNTKRPLRGSNIQLNAVICALNQSFKL